MVKKKGQRIYLDLYGFIKKKNQRIDANLYKFMLRATDLSWFLWIYEKNHGVMPICMDLSERRGIHMDL